MNTPDHRELDGFATLDFATPDEIRRGIVLEKVVGQLLRGEPHDLAQLSSESQIAVPEITQDIAAVTLLFQCATHLYQESGAPTEASSEQTLPNCFPGEFAFRQLLGEGNFGKVYLADDVNLHRPVAIKTLKTPVHSPNWPQTLAALRQESQFLAKLSHPNIVRVLAWREVQSQYYLILQYVPGGSLGDKLKEGLSWSEAVRYITDVGEALVAAHEHGVIHRDIKPDNILWDPDLDEAVLTDFGVSARLADSGSIAGTPFYMAPEAFSGEISPATDVYSLAATLFHLITGKTPFRSKTLDELIEEKQTSPVEADLYFPGMPQIVEQAIMAALAGDPRQRPAMPEFVKLLRRSLNQLLADSLDQRPDRTAAAQIELRINRRTRNSHFEIVKQTSARLGRSRDMRKVPVVPSQVQLVTGDEVQIDVSVDQPGHVVVFNIGPTGNLNLLYPDNLSDVAAVSAGHRSLRVDGITLTAPAGTERLFALWTRRPFPLRSDQLLSLGEPGKIVTRAYRTTRDMKRLQSSLQQLPPADWSVTVLELAHVEP